MDQNDILKVTVVIPSLNPDEKLLSTIRGVLDVGFKDIILVNDGSDSEHLEPFKEATQFPEVTLLTHEVNKGKGRAMKTAMAWFLENRKESPGIVTMDGDGQHAPEDVFECSKAMLEGDTVVLGVRDFSGKDVPWKSKAGNNITKFIFRAFCGIKISDTQTGLRAFPARLIGQFSEFYGERYEYETNMLLEMKHAKIPFKEVTIRTIYLDDNVRSHFNPFKDGFRIYSVIFKFLGRNLGSFVKFAVSSGACAIIDVLLFHLLNMLFGLIFPQLAESHAIIIANICARVVSSLCNYSINRKAVFGGGNKTSVVRYYVLAVVQMLISSLLIAGVFEGVKAILNLDISGNNFAKTCFKIVVDTTLFFVSYKIQKKWVFKKENENE